MYLFYAILKLYWLLGYIVCVCAWKDSLSHVWPCSHISHTLAHRPRALHLKTTNQELISCIINWPACWIFQYLVVAGSRNGPVDAEVEIDGVSGLGSIGGGLCNCRLLRKKKNGRMWVVGQKEMTVLWACCESLMMFWWLLRVTVLEPLVRKGRVRTPT